MSIFLASTAKARDRDNKEDEHRGYSCVCVCVLCVCMCVCACVLCICVSCAYYLVRVFEQVHGSVYAPRLLIKLLVRSRKRRQDVERLRLFIEKSPRIEMRTLEVALFFDHLVNDLLANTKRKLFLVLLVSLVQHCPLVVSETSKVCRPSLCFDQNVSVGA